MDIKEVIEQCGVLVDAITVQDIHIPGYEDEELVQLGHDIADHRFEKTHEGTDD